MPALTQGIGGGCSAELVAGFSISQEKSLEEAIEVVKRTPNEEIAKVKY